MSTATMEKPYQIKKDAESGKFKILDEAGNAFAGCEGKEFGSPIEASRFVKSQMKEDITPTPTSTIPEKQAEIPIEQPTVQNTEGFQIPIIEGRDPVIEVVGKTRYFEVTIREHDEPKRTSEPITDGFNTTYYVALGKKVILPEAVINTAKEAVYTIIETHQDETTMKVTNTPREQPRFSVDIHREVSADEAQKWLIAQRKVNINIF